MQPSVIGTNYAKQFILHVNRRIPPILIKGKLVHTESIMLENNHTLSEDIHFYWTDDTITAALHTTGWNLPHTGCNVNIGARDPSKLYHYRCLEAQPCYIIEEDPEIDFTLKLPDYKRRPYSYIHYVNVGNRTMNLFQMYQNLLSHNLSMKLQ